MDEHANETPFNTGLNCQKSGVFVVDVDPRNGGLESLDLLEEMLEAQLPQTVTAETGAYELNGKTVRGMHLYFVAPAGASLRTELPKELSLPGIDIKHNGYVIIPPSKHASGVTYRWRAGQAPWEIEVAKASQELLDLITKRRGGNPTATPLKPEEIEALVSSDTETTPYGQKALEDECDLVRRTREGTRNKQLFESGLKIGSLISGREINPHEALGALEDAALITGLEIDEIQNVLVRNGDGALYKGMASPRSADKGVIPKSYKNRLDGSRVQEPDEILACANLVDWKELFTSPPVEDDWYVPGFICSKRAHSLYSDAGVGKSLLMREISACLASGRSALGYPERDPLKVLYLDYENDPSTDIRSSLTAMGFTHEDLKNLHMASLPFELGSFDNAQGGARVIALVKELNPDLVVIDTLSRVVEGEENQNDTWIKFYNFTGIRLKQLGVAYVRLDHEGKNADAGARGGSAKRGDVDLIWRYSKKTSTKDQFKLKNEKSRGILPADEIHIKRLSDPLLRHIVSKTSESGSASLSELFFENNPHQEAINLINTYVEQYGKLPGQRELWKQMRSECQRLKVSRDTLYEALKFAKEGETDVEPYEE